jgi:hypothetical protein
MPGVALVPTPRIIMFWDGTWGCSPADKYHRRDGA